MLEDFLARLKAGEPITFAETMELIDGFYDYEPALFSNGLAKNRLDNPAGSNEGSCKIFAFARLNGLPEGQTLALFGDYYRRDVLGDPDGNDHRNIRNFIQYGWKGIQFEKMPLTPRQSRRLKTDNRGLNPMTED